MIAVNEPPGTRHAPGCWKRRYISGILTITGKWRWHTGVIMAIACHVGLAAGLSASERALPQDTLPPIVVSGPPSQPAPVGQTAVDSVQTLLDSLGLDLSTLRSALTDGPAPIGARADSVAQAPDASTIVQGAARNLRFWGIRTFWAIVVLTAAYYIISFIVLVLEGLSERITTRRLFIKRLVPAVRLLVWAFAVYYVITGVYSIDRTSLIAAAAAIGVAVGLAAQDVLKNIFGGVIIILDRPFQVGDKVRIDDTYGEVQSIGLRATRIVTADDNLVSVPNLKVVEGQVSNANAGALDCQVAVNLYLPGWVDNDTAVEVAYDAAATSRYVFLNKPIVVHVADEFRETFLTHLTVRAYVLDTRFELELANDITQTAKREFRRLGLIPAVVTPALHSVGPAQ